MNAYHLKERYSLHEAAIEETPEFNLAERSSMLRSRFREIPSLSPQIALNTLMTQRLPPQLRAWRPTFELAKAILSGKGAKHVPKQEEVLLDMCTSKCRKYGKNS